MGDARDHAPIRQPRSRLRLERHLEPDQVTEGLVAETRECVAKSRALLQSTALQIEAMERLLTGWRRSDPEPGLAEGTEEADGETRRQAPGP